MKANLVLVIALASLIYGGVCAGFTHRHGSPWLVDDIERPDNMLFTEMRSREPVPMSLAEVLQAMKNGGGSRAEADTRHSRIANRLGQVLTGNQRRGHSSFRLKLGSEKPERRRYANLHTEADMYAIGLRPGQQHNGDLGMEPELLTPRNRLFTPNGDGYNDTVKIRVKAEPNSEIELKIFDLTGWRIFSDGNPIPERSDSDGIQIFSFTWDGDPPSSDLVGMGIYVYVVKVGRKGFSGTITLISGKAKIPE